MTRWIIPVAGGLVAAALGFWLTLGWAPAFMMGKAMDRIEAVGPGYNAVFHGPITDETSRRVVRPSPDILYSVCLYDLSDGPVELSVPWPEDGSYASVSFYDADTNNFAVVNDRDSDSASNSIALIHLNSAARSQTLPDLREGRDLQVVSPSSQGLALYRRVLMGDTPVEQADAERRAFDCSVPTPSE
jgi:uncharacterized membrane protein